MAGKKAAGRAVASATGEPGASGGFRGFGSQALPFLMALRENNERAWFAANKAIFLEELDAPFRELVGEVGGLMAAAGLAVAPVAKNPVYRIYRDVRFSKDKRPYKVHLGAGFHREGDKSRPGLVYLHVEPAGSFVAAGFYQSEPPLLKAIRGAIAGDAPGFDRLVRSLADRGIAMDAGEPLTRMPKGFEGLADSTVAGPIRMRSFLVARPLADDDLERRDLAARVAGFAADVAPFLKFFWSRIDQD